jgi:hypothetical protein
MLWIDDATGKIVDRSWHPEFRNAVDEVRPALTAMPRQRVPEARGVFVDLVGPRPPVMIDRGMVERPRLSWKPVPLLSGKEGGS